MTRKITVRKKRWTLRRLDSRTETRRYRAYDEGRRSSSMLRIDFGGGYVGLLDRRTRLEVVSPSDAYLSLVFGHVVLTFEGRSLSTLLKGFQEDRICGLYCFNPQTDDWPAEGEPVITAVMRQNLAEFAQGEPPVLVSGA